MPKPTTERKHLIEKRNELLWALALQEYRDTDIAVIFNINRSSVKPIMRKMPKDWVPKWKKTE